jgi:hypothetical protein
MLLKALQNYITPQVTPTKTYPDVNLLNQILYGQFTASTLVVWYDSNQQTFIDKGYKGNALVYSIIRKIAEKGKQCPTYVYKESEASKKYRGGKYNSKELNRLQSIAFRKKELEDVNYLDPVNQLIKNPNPMQTWSEFLDSMLTWYNTSGEIFVYGFAPQDGLNKGKIKEMYILPSNYVEIVAGSLFEPVRGYKLIIGDQNIEIPADQVLHIKTTNLTWDLNGAQLRGMGQGLDLHTRIVVIKLAVHRPALAFKQIAQRIAQSRLSAMAHMQGTGGVGRNKFNQQALAAGGLLAKGVRSLQDLAHHLLLGLGLQAQV